MKKLLDNREQLCYTTLSDMENLLKLHYENAKLKGIWHFSLPSGWTCPGAMNCRTKVDKQTGLTRGGTLRVHIGGDYYNQSYFNAWMAAAKFFPNVVFYSYTKSIHLLQRYLADKGKLPSNFVFTCSKGGLFDHLIPSTNTKSARVFFSNEEAKALGLDIDHTDDFAISGSDDFALVLHGSQPAKSKASKALSELKKKGFTGYSKKKPVTA